MAGFVHFDPDNWQPPDCEDGAAKVAKVAKVGGVDRGTLAALATLAGVHAAGVRALDPDRPPRGVAAPAWACAVRDARVILEGGWADAATGLGWSALDLFGGQVDKAGDPHADGLAVWLQGRRVVALTDSHAIATDANAGRHFFNRPRSPGSTLLWALGRGK